MNKQPGKKEFPREKPGLHPRNKHRDRYDFAKLNASLPALARFVKVNAYGDESVDFSDAAAVKMLNSALLKYFYGIDFWEIPDGYLCPPIPGRADYIHHMADLLAAGNSGKIPNGQGTRLLDIGTGSGCIYPIIANREYGWSCTASDIDPESVRSANRIVMFNPALEGEIEIRLQSNPRDVFRGIIKEGEIFDLVVCNPPFHASAEEARSVALRKTAHLSGIKVQSPLLNFGGKNNELWCDGGEERFIRDMIFESRRYSTSCKWFSTQVSKKDHLRGVYHHLKKVEATEVKTIPTSQGNKAGRVVAWRFAANT
jgi:23S rRNA (adenine1618-N6)-methyltransferase